MYSFQKRTLDILVAVLILSVLSPLLIPIVILLKLTCEGYVFYWQERIGYLNQKFKILHTGQHYDEKMPDIFFSK